MTDVLEELAKVLEQRKEQAPESSYVASLYAKGTDAILRKVGEESSEVIIAAKAGDHDALVHEVADLWFHTLVLLAHAGLSPGDIMAELQRRFGQSGLEEKAQRGR